MSASRIKAADRTKVCQQLVTELKKRYSSRVPKTERNVLDSLLFAVCLENSSHDKAELALKRLHESFFDYNEARVSSITELQHVFVDSTEPEWRAMRVRETLQFVFEGRYSYDLEDFRKRNLDSAEKYLKNIKSLTPFIVAYTMLTTLKTHTVPCSDSITRLSIWLGLLPDQTDVVAANDLLKAAVRKSDVPLFLFLINEAANDPEFQEVITKVPIPDQADPLETLKGATSRLKDLIAGKITPAKPAKKKKAAESTSAPKKKTTKTKSAAGSTKTKTETKKKTATKTSKKTSAGTKTKKKTR